ncbi:MAG TPA: hypothetical protein VIL32_01755, partial [Steroidobacteraceae bacterium]
SWVDSAGRTWTGMLYLPTHHAPGRRYPLVIQTHGHAGEGQFSLYGPAIKRLGPGVSVFAAQPLANRGILVVQLQDRTDDEAFGTVAEPAMYMDGYDSLVAHLDRKGLIDKTRVGIVGFSRTGWHVEYALTHSETPFAAAIVSDNLDAGYFQAAVTGWAQSFNALSGGAPFGAGLKSWLEHAPPFSAERIATPLRMQVESAGLMGALQEWELFSRLRALGKPVELAFVPDLEGATHGLQNPRQLLASQQAAVDWFDFWLNDREDPDAAKQSQYVRWRRLREQRDAQIGKPRPPLLEWSSRPRTVIETPAAENDRTRLQDADS